jgi:hypothetical protein
MATGTFLSLLTLTYTFQLIKQCILGNRLVGVSELYIKLTNQFNIFVFSITGLSIYVGKNIKKNPAIK